MFNILNKTGDFDFLISEISNKKERELLLELLSFPELLLNIEKSYQVHQLAHYLFMLAKKSHAFYTESRVIENDKVNQNRASIVKLALEILKSGLDLLGII